MLAAPKLVALDSSTLGKVSRDYWSTDSQARHKARTFICQLRDLGVFVTFTLTHVFELIRHGDERVVRNRIKFLHDIPLIAWLRPFDRHWFPGDIPDLLTRELHVVVNGLASDWREIVDEVRSDLWETGTGSEMFVVDDRFWKVMTIEAKRQHENEKLVASVARTDPAAVYDTKVGELIRAPRRLKEERVAYMSRFAQKMQRQLERHGDKRLERSRDIAVDFAQEALKRVEAIERTQDDPIQSILELKGVPAEVVSPQMTVGEVGDRAVYAAQLKILAKNLQPAVELTFKDVPPDTLPSYVLERRLKTIQMKSERVCGSDLGDGYVAPLVFYCDGVEVDKRTFEFLSQLQRTAPRLASLMGRYFRSNDYSQIPAYFES